MSFRDQPDGREYITLDADTDRDLSAHVIHLADQDRQEGLKGLEKWVAEFRRDMAERGLHNATATLSHVVLYHPGVFPGATLAERHEAIVFVFAMALGELAKTDWRRE